MTPTPALDADWLQRLAARLDDPPRRPRVALALAVDEAPAATIGSIESTLALRLAGAGLPLRDAGEAWQIEVAEAGAVEPAFDAVARWLAANGCARGWRDERLAVVDDRGRRVGAIERGVVRPLGIATLAVHLVLVDERGGVWLQQRAFDKSTDPGAWDTAVGGLAADGESIATALERETWEEAGLRLDALRGVESFGRFTVRRPLDEGYMVEHIEMVEAVVPGAGVPRNLDGEVAGFECVDVATLVGRLHADAFTLEAAQVFAHWLAHRAAAR